MGEIMINNEIQKLLTPLLPAESQTKETQQMKLMLKDANPPACEHRATRGLRANQEGRINETDNCPTQAASNVRKRT